MSPLEIEPVTPFRLDYTSWTVRRRAHNATDLWDPGSGTHRRSISINGKPVAVAVTQNVDTDRASISVETSGEFAGPEMDGDVDRAVKRLFGLERDLSGFYEMAAGDPVLEPVVARLRGAKPPRFPSAFEALVNAVACQQISVDAGMHVLNRLSAKYGTPVPGDEQAPFVFPGPEDLAGAEIEEVKQVGFSFNKARTVVEAAQKIVTGDLELEELESAGDEEALKELTALYGVGRWTAEYVLLRGLGRIHVLPGDDVGAQNKLRVLFGITSKLDYESVGELTSRWSPYGGLIYFHLILDSIVD